MGRPFRLCLSQSKWEQVQCVMSSLEKIFPPSCEQSLEATLEGATLNKVEREEYKVGKVLREKLCQIGSVNFTTNQISLNIEVSRNSKAKSELYTSLSGLNLNLSTLRKKNNQHEEDNKRMITEISFKGSMQDLQVKTISQNLEIQMLLKPWTAFAEVKLVWLQWKIEPYLTVKVESEIIQINFGPENLFCLVEIWKYLDQFLREFATEKEQSPQAVVSRPANEEVYSDLFFQDDLRAGVFQYISCPTSQTKEIFPQPYQVVFDKPLGIMAWCYPESRALIRVDIYPVPFVAASEVSTLTYDTEESELVLCALQYYDSLRNAFITYQRFHLSESKFFQLDLPSVHEKKLLAVSNVWRVCIDYRDEEEDESLKGASSLLSPEALAACMRVDSLFSVDILPTTQAVFQINKCDVTLVNHMDLTGSKLPPKFKDYTLDDNIPNKQAFITFSLDNICVRTYSWTKGNYIEATTKVSTHVLNYKSLTNNILLEHSNLNVGINSQEAEDQKPQCYDCSVMAKTMHIHINQSTVHTLTVASECWKQAFLIVEDPTIGLCSAIKTSLPAVLMTNYILRNNTSETIRFGQVNTDENLMLESGVAHLYCWRSHKFPPNLRVCIESNKWKWCDPIQLEDEGTQVCAIFTLLVNGELPQLSSQGGRVGQNGEDLLLYLCLDEVGDLKNKSIVGLLSQSKQRSWGETFGHVQEIFPQANVRHLRGNFVRRELALRRSGIPSDGETEWRRRPRLISPQEEDSLPFPVQRPSFPSSQNVRLGHLVRRNSSLRRGRSQGLCHCADSFENEEGMHFGFVQSLQREDRIRLATSRALQSALCRQISLAAISFSLRHNLQRKFNATGKNDFCLANLESDLVIFWGGIFFFLMSKDLVTCLGVVVRLNIILGCLKVVFGF